MLGKKISSTDKTTKVTRWKEILGEINVTKALTEVSRKTTIGHPAIGEINKARTQEIRAHTTTGHEASDRANNIKITTDQQIKEGIKAYQTDPKIAIGTNKTGM